MSAMVNPYASGGNLYSLIVGSHTEEIEIPKTGTVFIDYSGFAASSPAAFGSLSPALWKGFTITAIYFSEGLTYFEVSGNASAETPLLRANGVDQLLGAGSFSGGKTTFTSGSTVANQFTPDGAAIPVRIT